MLRSGLFALSLVLVSFTSAHADEAGARLMAQMKEAMGGAALDAPKGFHETGALGQGDHAATYETWGDLHALRSVSQMNRGGATFTRGFDGKQAWMMGPDGKVRTDSSPAGIASAKLTAYLTVGGYFYPGRFPADFAYKGKKDANGKSYDVVTITPKGCDPIDFWLDVQDHKLQRMTGTDQGQAFVGEVKSYKMIDKVWVGVEITQSVGGHETRLHLASYKFADVPADKFAPPTSK